MTTADFLIEDPFSGFSGEDKLKAHPKKFQKIPKTPSSPQKIPKTCRQWDPLGLARRLPSLGVGAWRCAPLLPWRVQCPVCVCAALAAGSGGFGPVTGVVSPLLPPSRPACPALRVAGRPVRVSLILARWYAIPCGLCVPRARSGCPSGSPRVSFSREKFIVFSALCFCFSCCLLLL